MVESEEPGNGYQQKTHLFKTALLPRSWRCSWQTSAQAGPRVGLRLGVISPSVKSDRAGLADLRRVALATLLSNPVKGSQAGRCHEAWSKGPVRGDIEHALHRCQEIRPTELHCRTSELVSKP